MKCYVVHTGQNFQKSFGPFETIEEAHAWVTSPRCKKLGIRGSVVPMVPPYADLTNVWEIDEVEEALKEEAHDGDD